MYVYWGEDGVTHVNVMSSDGPLIVLNWWLGDVILYGAPKERERGTEKEGERER